MWIDFAAAAVLILSIFRGDRRGFIRSFVSCFGWLISAISAMILYSDFLAVVDQYTGIRAGIHNKLLYYAKLRLVQESGLVDDQATTTMIMDALRKNAENVYNQAAETVVAPVTDMIMNILGVAAVMIAIRLLFALFTLIFSLIADNNGPAGFVNSVLGMTFGVVEAVFVIYFLLLMTIFVAIIGNFPLLTEQIMNSVCINALEAVRLIPKMDTLTALLAA